MSQAQAAVWLWVLRRTVPQCCMFGFWVTETRGEIVSGWVGGWMAIDRCMYWGCVVGDFVWFILEMLMTASTSVTRRDMVKLQIHTTPHHTRPSPNHDIILYNTVFNTLQTPSSPSSTPSPPKTHSTASPAHSAHPTPSPHSPHPPTPSTQHCSPPDPSPAANRPARPSQPPPRAPASA